MENSVKLEDDTFTLECLKYILEAGRILYGENEIQTENEMIMKLALNDERAG